MIILKRLLIVLIILILSACESKQGEPGPYAIEWEVITNFTDSGGRFLSALTITNLNGRVLNETGWTLYFNYRWRIVPDSVPSFILLTHINGDFYKIEPATGFSALLPGSEITIQTEAFGSAVRDGDAPEGFYFEFHDDSIVSVPVITVIPFDREEQLYRGPADEVPVSTAEVLFRQNSYLSLLPSGDVGKITPTPVYTEDKDGYFVLSPDVRIVYDSALMNEARFLAGYIADHTGARPSIERSNSNSNVNGNSNSNGNGDVYNKPTDRHGSVIGLKLVETLGSDRIADAAESYRLILDSNRITVTATDPAGIFRGIQSLRSLVSAGEPADRNADIMLPSILVEDAPRFGYRGFHLDVSRNFQPAETVKKLLDIMAMYKLNVFHFHLTDDEGWRVAIDPLPELTTTGGRRGHSHTGTDMLVPSWGSGPDPSTGVSFGSGWYSRDEYIELLRYARDRHIEVIPEIDVPGHARAAIVSMKARYERLSAAGDADGAAQYRLDDPDDRSEYLSIQGWDDNVINVCQEPAYRFMEVVIDELIDMHREAGIKLTTIHMGGDEVPVGVWEGSPLCMQIIEESDDLETARDLQDYFFERIRQMLVARGLFMGGWEEIALGHPVPGGQAQLNTTFVGDVRPYVWHNVWGSGTEDHAYRLANAGYQIVMSHASSFYFDLAYEKHPSEPGLIWAGFTDLKEAYSFIPFDLYKNAVQDAYGRTIAEDAYNGRERLSEHARRNILGLQGQLWSETLNKPGRVEYMALPRMIELAERAWAPDPEWSLIPGRAEREESINHTWNEFANRLGQRELLRLDIHEGGTMYRIPAPGAIVDDGLLYVNVALPGLTIRYTTDGSIPDSSSAIYSMPLPVGERSTIQMRAFDSNNRGSRSAIVNFHE